jgi:hypothetical protein
MEIVRTTAKGGSILPKALEVIRRVPDEAWTHDSQGILHPRTSYTRAFAKVTEAWEEVFPALSTLTAQLRFHQPAPDSKQVESTYSKLLHALYEQVDACYAVMRCLAPPPEKQGIWHQAAARSQKLPGLAAFEEQVIRGYRNLSLGPSVNLIKHNESRIRLIALRSQEVFTLGYFIDGPLAGGVIGPAQSVHPDTNSAFSFNRDMLMHWWWLYRTSELLANVIELTIGDRLQTPKEALEASEKWVALCRNISAISPDFMPDEVERPYPLVIAHPSGNSLRLKFPAGRKANQVTADAKLTALITIDEGGQQYKLPYVSTDENVITVEGH